MQAMPIGTMENDAIKPRMSVNTQTLGAFDIHGNVEWLSDAYSASCNGEFSCRSSQWRTDSRRFIRGSSWKGLVRHAFSHVRQGNL